jgi:hypothetical protein
MIHGTTHGVIFSGLHFTHSFNCDFFEMIGQLQCARTCTYLEVYIYTYFNEPDEQVLIIIQCKNKLASGRANERGKKN